MRGGGKAPHVRVAKPAAQAPAGLGPLREALANCLTNASFSERRGVVCLWTENALVLKNPGDFRMDLGQALKGGISDPRNANLLKMFSFIDIGERAGSGIPSIVRNWTASGYERPRWEEEFGPDWTTLVLPLAQSANEREARDEAGDKSRRQGPATNGKNIRQAGVMDSKRQRSTARTNGKAPAISAWRTSSRYWPWRVIRVP